MNRKVSSNNWASAFMCQWWQLVIEVYSGVFDKEIHIQFVLGLQPGVNLQNNEQEVLEQHENNQQENNRALSFHNIYPIQLHWHLSTQVEQVKRVFTQQQLSAAHNTPPAYDRGRGTALLITLAKHTVWLPPGLTSGRGQRTKSKAHCPTSSESHSPLWYSQQPTWHLP